MNSFNERVAASRSCLDVAPCSTITHAAAYSGGNIFFVKSASNPLSSPIILWVISAIFFSLSSSASSGIGLLSFILLPHNSMCFIFHNSNAPAHNTTIHPRMFPIRWSCSSPSKVSPPSTGPRMPSDSRSLRPSLSGHLRMSLRRCAMIPFIRHDFAVHDRHYPVHPVQDFLSFVSQRYDFHVVPSSFGFFNQTHLD